MHIHYHDLYGDAFAKNPCPGGHEIYNFGRPFLGHHMYNVYTYFVLRLGEEKKLFKDIWPHPLTGIPALCVMKFTILVDPSLDIITIPSVCLILICAWE